MGLRILEEVPLGISRSVNEASHPWSQERLRPRVNGDLDIARARSLQGSKELALDIQCG